MVWLFTAPSPGRREIGSLNEGPQSDGSAHRGARRPLIAVGATFSKASTMRQEGALLGHHALQ